jgi:hypothetical protein
MILYHGFRDRYYDAYVWRLTSGKKHLLRLRRDLEKHSTAFSWGCDEKGAAQLALALLADALGNDVRALKLHQQFKRRVVANLPDEWRLTPQQIIDHAHEIEEFETEIPIEITVLGDGDNGRSD